MWLINVETYKLTFFHNETQVPYAILSHRWGGHEVSHNDMLRGLHNISDEMQMSWDKIEKSCQQAQIDNLQFVWVDTCCIDKSSSAELQEAINSMFRWYRQAVVCYAFLSDVDYDMEYEGVVSRANTYEPRSRFLRNSEWFRRGWTLQELIAPKNVVFYDAEWRPLGSRNELARLIHEITGVTMTILEHGYEERPCVADIMSWAAGRETTRLEDRAYSLLGLFGISMPLLYGEGGMAFIRLQEEILRRNDDQSIFAWAGPKRIARRNIGPGLLATSPDQFSPLPSSHTYLSPATFPRRAAHSVTNEGISVQLQLLPVKPRVYIALLNPGIDGPPTNTEVSSTGPSRCRILIYLKRIDAFRYARWGKELDYKDLDLTCAVRSLTNASAQQSSLRQVIVVNSLKNHERAALLVDRNVALRVDKGTDSNDDCGIEVCLQGHPGMITPFKIDNEIKHGLAYFIWLKPYGPDGNVPSIRVQSVAFQFDFDLNPICILSIDWPGQGETVTVSRVAYRNEEYTSNPFPSSPELSIYIDGGEWRNESREIVAIRPAVDNIFSGKGFSAKIRSRYIGESGGVISIHMSENIEAGCWNATVTTNVWKYRNFDIVSKITDVSHGREHGTSD